MSQLQNYQVDYTINVEATQGVRQVENFAAAVSKLVDARKNLDPAVKNVNTMMNSIDRLFRNQKGRKRDFTYKMDIDITNAEANLTKIKGLLSEIKQTARGLKINVAPVNKRNLKKEITGLAKTEHKKPVNAINSNNAIERQRQITRAIGKVNAGLLSLERGRKINIQTGDSKRRLLELLGILRRIKKSTNMGLSLGLPAGLSGGMYAGRPVIPFAANKQFPISDKAQAKLQEKLWMNQQLFQQKQDFRNREAADKAQRRLNQNSIVRRDKQERQRKRQNQDIPRQNAVQIVRDAQTNNAAYTSRQRGAINRLQYAKAPSLRNMPFAYMFNAYMGYSLLRKELSEAVEYSNIMETAHSILKVADNDLATFETRFDNMARYVRQIGIETKFTAIEVGGAVKYLAMAGMGIEAINNSIRPVTNLALIGDNDISQIADLATNIMAGYNIKSESMDSVADILASTVSRSNVNIIEMAESYKMASGYLKIAGIDFSESAAAIGILGNSGIKGTMAGTSLRGMATRFAKPTKEAKKVLDRLNVKFTEQHDVFGEKVERMRPLADIFEELNAKGAGLEDSIAIFGKTAGSGAMMLLQNHEKLRELASQNRVSQGISGELAKVKQETTKGLWYQMTSMFSESFMRGFEILEPQIKSTLKSFISKFSSEDFSKGLVSIGETLINLLSVLANIATWVTKNFHWIEPLLFTGIVATKLFKLAGAITNLGVAMGFLGRQSAAGSAMHMISGLVGMGGAGGIRGALSMTDKRSLVTALRGAGITGKGAMTAALAQGGVSSLMARAGTSGLFASQVASGSGLVGAGASLSAIGTGAVAATAGLAILAGALGWVAYKTWKVKEAKDAVQEEITANRKYDYPSVTALYKSLHDAYKMAVATKGAMDDLTGKSIEEASGQTIGAFTPNWWAAAASSMSGSRHYGGFQPVNTYSFADGLQDDAVAAIETIAAKARQPLVNSAYAAMARFKTEWELKAFMENIKKEYGVPDSSLDPKLWTEVNGVKKYVKEFKEMDASAAAKTWHYQNYHNVHTLKDIEAGATGYKTAISSQAAAMHELGKTGVYFSELKKNGFYVNKDGKWTQRVKGRNSTDEEKANELKNSLDVRSSLRIAVKSLRETYGGSTQIAENIMEKAGFSKELYSNEPDSNEKKPWDANGITSNGSGGDDGMAGGNYSGTGKLSSAAPKQVIVNISNLMSVATIDLMKTPDGQTKEIQNLKEQLAQALIDVVHDFDASWNG